MSLTDAEKTALTDALDFLERAHRTTVLRPVCGDPFGDAYCPYDEVTLPGARLIDEVVR